MAIKYIRIIFLLNIFWSFDVSISFYVLFVFCHHHHDYILKYTKILYFLETPVKIAFFFPKVFSVFQKWTKKMSKIENLGIFLEKNVRKTMIVTIQKFSFKKCDDNFSKKTKKKII